jgi:hypothetical protein
MRSLLLAISIFIVGCAPEAYADPELAPYYETFKGIVHEVEAEAQVEIEIRGDESYQITFVDTYGEESSTVGQCEQHMTHWEVTVLRSFWDEIDEIARTVLMYHEFTHCALDKGHVESRGHYMNSYLQPWFFPSLEYVHCHVKGAILRWYSPSGTPEPVC